MNYSSSFLMLFFGFTLFAQQPNVNELRKAQEIRKTYIQKENSKGQYHLSKSLYVDPFIGTGGHGHTYPGASAPFGMIQLSPDTRHDGWDGCSGYHYTDSILYGFSHTHLSGTGVPDYCDLLIVPQSGTPKTTPGYIDPTSGYGDRFSHEQENASPGFYEVKLLKQQINVRLTVSERAGIHEYTFLNPKGKKFILIDLDHRDKLLGHSIKILDKKTISGHRISQSWATEQHFYFHMETSVPHQKARLINKKGQQKLLLTFPAETEKILIRVGISAVDTEGAKNNLKNEIPDWDFNAVRAKTTRSWDVELGRIDFRTKNTDHMINFYTGLYHASLQPNVFSDFDGRYRGRDNKIHSITDNIRQYTVFSLWDTYRATHPLYTIIQRERTNEFIHTFLRQYEQGGDLPVWELAGNETECMIGYHSVSVIADAYIKGIRNFDADKALNAMVQTSRFDELGKPYFRRNGFISSRDEPESVSKTLEYAYNDFCIARMATEMGKMDIYQEYYRSSLNFINLYDPKTKFMRARRGGLWYSPFDPAEVNFNYTEANSWQYSLYAPHAANILSELMGGKDSLENWLDRLFTTNMELSGRHQVDITGLIGQYAHGNEPSHHMAYLYNYTNAPHKSQQYIDRIFNEMYSPTPDGLSGNEDCGQMSAWYVLSALGFYQVTPGHPWYDFGRPLMDEATIHLENGKKINIKALNNSIKNKYVQSITWNGKKLESSQIHTSALQDGGELLFTMGPKPSGQKILSSNSALNTDELVRSRFVPSPFFLNENRVFDGSAKVSIGSLPALNNETINLEYRYANDTNTVFPYSKPFVINSSVSIEARRMDIHHPAPNSMPSLEVNYSPWVRADFIKRDQTISLDLKSEYSHQYASTGRNALIDGVQGGNEFRTGDYQGYWAQDLITEVSFSEPRVLKEIGISCLQDMKSWIFYPSEILIEVSYDGINFEALQPISTDKSNSSKNASGSTIPLFNDYVGPTNADFFTPTNSSRPIHKIKLHAKNFGQCPSWHLGAGSGTWLFTDELIFR